MATTQVANHAQPPLEEPITCPDHLDGVAYLYGHPLINSLSPPLHQTVYKKLGLNWTQIPLSSVTGKSATYPPPYTKSPPIDKYLAAIRANPKFVGSSVTMPWKVAIMPHLDEMTEDAQQAGACNTIFIRQEAGNKRTYVGTNTDCIGIREALVQNAPASPEDPFRGKPALIVGGGGTARSAIYVMRKWLGASKIYIVNRDRAEVEAILREDNQRNPDSTKAPLIHVSDPATAAAADKPAAIVSGIPNYPPKTPEELCARETLQAFLGPHQSSSEPYRGVILEMCYHPTPYTEIATLASATGWKVIMGTEALIWQGLEQARLWTGRDVVAVPGLVQAVRDMVSKSIADRTPKLSKI
ncbi:putative quinate 5-dehydrogenase [Aspergillus taichungensis]|uniref:Putative quinate 5-dehydrogenase n=1 Tax=Aspergillus taichungensis TaxID=482145 RepID=A0A2J5I3E7_9EURO|nr:putative quinate 5-dehydrogenase [Aspergillus taichungensis]